MYVQGSLMPVDADRDGTVDYYIYEPPAGVAADERALAGMARRARRHGIAPRAFAGLVHDLMCEKAAALGQAERARAAGLAVLQDEWGPQFEANAATAAGLMYELGFGAQALRDPRLLHAFHVIASRLAGRAEAAPAPDEAARANALRAIAAIRGDGAHAYHDGAHPGHARAVADMETLYRIAYPG